MKYLFILFIIIIGFSCSSKKDETPLSPINLHRVGNVKMWALLDTTASNARIVRIFPPSTYRWRIDSLIISDKKLSEITKNRILLVTGDE